MKELRLCDNGDFSGVSELCKREHLGIEVQSFYDPYLENFDEIFQEHLKVLQSMTTGKSLHAPCWDLNLGTKMKGLRKETMDMFNHAYHTAKKLGCTEVVVHNGYIPGTYFYSGWVERAVEFWKEFFSDKDDSIVMCLENQFEEDSEILRMEIDSVADPRLKICLDVGHAYANSNMPIEGWIISLKDRIAYLHLHNNHGNQYRKGYHKDEHLGINNGTMNMENVLNLAEAYCPDAIWNIESSAAELEESLLFLKEHGYFSSNQNE